MIKLISKDQVITNDWTIEEIAIKRPSPSWEDVFEKAKAELKDISEILEEDKKLHGRFYPDSNKIFRCLNLTPLNKVKVVIIGQDPYHGVNQDGTPQAQGMAFSVKRGSRIPPSLINIYKELANTVENFTKPNHGDLTKWALQGVLLLNSSLTVRPGQAGSHKEVWFGFIKKIINAILSYHKKNIIFVLWGKKAQKIKKIIGHQATCLETSHPSGFSAYRGFFGCDHFNQINQLLRERHKSEIDWSL